jgi:hypothetical protein
MIQKSLESRLMSYLVGHADLLKDNINLADVARLIAWREAANETKIKAGLMMPHVGPKQAASKQLDLGSICPMLGIAASSLEEESGLRIYDGEVFINA